MFVDLFELLYLWDCVFVVELFLDWFCIYGWFSLGGWFWLFVLDLLVWVGFLFCGLFVCLFVWSFNDMVLFLLQGLWVGCVVWFSLFGWCCVVMVGGFVLLGVSLVLFFDCLFCVVI